MLKWLVTRTSNSQESPLEVITDDPLATLSRRSDKKKPVYAVSRVNPLFLEDIEEVDLDNVEKPIKRQITATVSKESPDSPSSCRESIRSSGYGSKEADNDSVSLNSDIQQENLGPLTIEEDPPTKSSCSNEISESLSSFVQNDLTSSSVACLARSFEIKIQTKNLQLQQPESKKIVKISKNADFVRDIQIPWHKSVPLEAIPEISFETDSDTTPIKKQSWPSVSNIASAIQKKTDKLCQRSEKTRLRHIGKGYEFQDVEDENIREHPNNGNQVLRFHPLVSVVEQNEQFVTSISLAPNRKSESDCETHYFPTSKIHVKGDEEVSRSEYQLKNYFNSSNKTTYYHSKSNNNEYPLLSLQPDSLVNEDTLKMMIYPNKDHEMYNEMNDQKNFSFGNIPRFGKALYSGFYSLHNSSSGSQESLVNSRKNHSLNLNYKRKGVNVVKDLWEKTGLKTNGRKLLVDVTRQINEERSPVHSRKIRNSISGSTRNWPSEANSERMVNLSYGCPYNLTNRNITEFRNIRSGFREASVSSASHSYEEIPESLRGNDNPSFIDDKGISVSSTVHSKSGQPFQHSLTEFQRRLSERLQGGMSSNTGNNTELESQHIHDATEEPTRRNYSNCLTNSHPGHVVREVGSSGERNTYKFNESHYAATPAWFETSNITHSNLLSSHSTNQSSRFPFWERIAPKTKNSRFPSNSRNYFRPHPNSEARLFSETSLRHDFTLDSKRYHKILHSSSKADRRRRCCIGVLIAIAFLIFVAVVIGFSWYSTGGQRFFGPI